MTKRELRIKALLAVGGAEELILDIDYSDVSEEYLEDFQKQVAEICATLKNIAKKMQYE